MEPLLAALQPRRLCEIGVDQGLFTRRLLAWGRENGCAYVGIDPAPGASVAELVSPDGRLAVGRSLDVLPGLEPCDAYFIDGDHNYHTVRHELDLIARADSASGPIVFVHDVSWPFARRDMYHQRDAIPPEARHPASEELGVTLESNDLVAGGLRSPGQYAIAQQPGGERNGVLTAVEDFLADTAGHDWQSVIVPLAYGLAILCRPASLPEGCRAVFDELRTAFKTLGGFLESCEANYLTLYLYAEEAKTRLAYWTGDGQPGQAAYLKLNNAFRDLKAHSDKLLQEFNQLLDAYHALERDSQRKEPA